MKVNTETASLPILHCRTAKSNRTAGGGVQRSSFYFFGIDFDEF